MKVTLSFEETVSSDVSIMVDVLRASTTITTTLDKFSEIIPCFTPEEAFKLKNKTDGVIAGERKGAKIEGFDIGNSPTAINEFETDRETLILTTSNGTRILEKMNSKYESRNRYSRKENISGHKYMERFSTLLLRET